MELNIKRKYLLSLGNWLGGLSLTGQQSRNRTKFVEALGEEVKEIELTRLEVLKKYADLDDKGEPKIVEKEDGTKNYVVADEKMKDFQDEYVKYLETEFTMGGPGLKTRLEIVRDIVLNPTVKIEPSDAFGYDKWCDAFEAMKE